jgi:DNA-binding transcriptional LysR family regulator
MTEIGIGVGLIPKHIAADLVTEHRLRMLPPLEGISPIDVHLIWNPKINKTKAEEVLIDFIQNALRQEAPDEPM